jgi:rhamnulokinase
MMALKTYNQPQLGIAETLLFMPDLLHFWLSGVKASEYSIASTSQMLDARTRRWDDAMLQSLNCRRIPARRRGAGNTVGHSARRCRSSLQPRCEHADRCTGQSRYGFGHRRRAGAGRKLAYLSSGTWSLMGIELPEPLIDTRVLQRGFTTKVAWRTRFVSEEHRWIVAGAGMPVAHGCGRATSTRMPN